MRISTMSLLLMCSAYSLSISSYSGSLQKSQELTLRAVMDPTSAIEDVLVKKESMKGETKTTVLEMKDSEDIPMFDVIAGRAAVCLFESEMRRDAREENSQKVPSGATNWINDAAAFALQKALDRVKLKVRSGRACVKRLAMRKILNTQTPFHSLQKRELA